MSGFIGVIASAVVIFACNTAWAENSFGLGKVEFFEEFSMNGSVSKQEQKPLDWREPIIGQDGKMTYYTPPAPLLALLQEPTEENAKVYLDWQREKDERISKAQAAIDAVSAKDK